MIGTGLIASFWVGLSVLNAVSLRLSVLEKLGLSFLIGIATQTLLMLGMDAMSIKLSAANVVIASFLLILILNATLFFRQKELEDRMRSARFALPDGFNLVWLVCMALIVYVEYMNWTKCMFYPTFDKDSLAGFDTIGWIISKEQTLKGLSVFQGDYMTHIHKAGSYITYMPMIQLSYAYVYSLGMETSKIIPALIYLSFLISFYAATVRFCGHTGAAVATFFVLVTPEMIGFSSLSGTNVIHAAYASLGVIYTLLWLKDRQQSTLVLAMLLMAFNLWVRNEGIVFVGAAVIVSFLYTFRARCFKQVLLYALVSVSPLVIWAIFMKVNGIYAESIVIVTPFVDTEKMHIITQYFKMLLSNTDYYGISFVAFGVAMLVNLWYIIKRRDMWALLAIIALSLLFYMIVLYQIDYKWDTIHNVLAYSAKRFLFCFMPLVWLYTVSNKIALALWVKLETLLTFKRK